MKRIKRIPPVEEVLEKYPITHAEKDLRSRKLMELKGIFNGSIKKKILIIGPCSADREDAVLEYAERLNRLQKQVEDVLFIIPRVYTSKPRTSGKGYKGLLHCPDFQDAQEDLSRGIVAMRSIHQKIVQNCQMFSADEMLYPDMLPYIADLLLYIAVGARSVEDQQHRLVASGVDVPAGMKNPTSGNLSVMLNGIQAAQAAQRIVYNGWEVQTDGNPYAHGILRGYVDYAGINHPNYQLESVEKLYNQYQQEGIMNCSILVDCNHSNSNKDYSLQGKIAMETFDMIRQDSRMNQFIKGLMIESYLMDGAQKFGMNEYGKSVTDACLGWEKTEELVLRLSEML